MGGKREAFVERSSSLFSTLFEGDLLSQRARAVPCCAPIRPRQAFLCEGQGAAMRAVKKRAHAGGEGKPKKEEKSDRGVNKKRVGKPAYRLRSKENLRKEKKIVARAPARASRKAIRSVLIEDAWQLGL